MSDTPPKQPRVVVAEDEALIRLDLVELLTGEGYEVVGEAGNGEEALKLVRELEPDLVVMDVKMPVMDGITAATAIAEDRIAPVVMLTAFSQRELVDRAREAGAMAYVVKPFDASDVVPAIELAMARFAEIRALDDEVADLEERLASRKAVDQAKGMLRKAWVFPRPKRSVGSRRQPWTCASRCARSPRASSITIRQASLRGRPRLRPWLTSTTSASVRRRRPSADGAAPAEGRR